MVDVTESPLRCNAGVDLTVKEFLQLDEGPKTKHTVPLRVHCGLQHGHRDAHIAFVQEPTSYNGDLVWWLRWDDTSRAIVELPHCLATDPDWPPDAEESDDMDCWLAKDHRGVHEWQMERPGLDCTREAHAIGESDKERLRQAPTPVGPLIRVHRYEYILAIKWPEFERWLMVWPDEHARDARPAANTEWRRLSFGDSDFENLHEWIDPTAHYHRDLLKWTAIIRQHLASTARSVDQTLKSIEAHPYNR